MAISSMLGFFFLCNLFLGAETELPTVHEVRIWDRLGGYRISWQEHFEKDGEHFIRHVIRTLQPTRQREDGGYQGLVRTTEHWLNRDTGRVVRALLLIQEGAAHLSREATFQEGEARIVIKSHDQPERVESLVLAAEVLVPVSPAAPAAVLQSSDRDELELDLFRLEDGTVSRVRVKRQGACSLTYHERTYACEKFSLTEGSRRSEFWLSPDGGLIRMEQQGLTLQPAGPEVVERFSRPPRAEPPFLAVSRKIGNRSTLSYLEVKGVIRFPEGGGVPELDGPGQSFMGSLEEGRAEGTFRIRSARSSEVESPGFSLETIENPHSEFAAIARQVTAQTHRRLEALFAIGAWIRKEVVVEAGGPDTAPEALRTRKAGAEGIARLHAALCQSVEIPARPVTGMIYVETETGAGFMGHFWCEVAMGNEQWFPVDPAAGELNYLDAGHIRLGRDVSFEPVRLEIVDYQPKPEPEPPPPTLRAGSFPLLPGETHVYAYFLNDQRTGTERVAFQEEKLLDGERIFAFTSEVALERIQGRTLTQTTDQGRLIHYRSRLGSRDATFRTEGAEVRCEIRTESQSIDESHALPEEGLFFANQQAFHLGFMISRFQLESGETVGVKAFHLDSRRILNLRVERKARQEERLKGKTWLVDHYEIRNGIQRFQLYLTDTGILVREIEQGGRVRVEWLGPE